MEEGHRAELQHRPPPWRPDRRDSSSEHQHSMHRWTLSDATPQVLMTWMFITLQPILRRSCGTAVHATFLQADRPAHDGREPCSIRIRPW